MSGRLEAAFARRRPVLVAYVMVGDPSIEVSLDVAAACVDAGASVIELGIPFSDPIADGPTIAHAAERALAAGVRLADVIDAAAELRRRRDTPIVLMGYANPLHRMGLEAFAERAGRAGVDAVLVPDLPYDHATELRAPLAARGVALPHLVAPTSTPERAAAIARSATGFVYLVSATGVTGSAAPDVAEVRANVAALRDRTPLPIVTGFGVRAPEQVAALARAGGGTPDGVVVGSAIVALASAPYASSAERVRAVTGLVRALESALHPKESTSC